MKKIQSCSKLPEMARKLVELVKFLKIGKSNLNDVFKFLNFENWKI